MNKNLSKMTWRYRNIWHCLQYFTLNRFLLTVDAATKSSSAKQAFFQYHTHFVKSVHIRSYSHLHFSAFGLNMERYGVSLLIQSECRKTRSRITPNTDTFYAVTKLVKF